MKSKSTLLVATLITLSTLALGASNVTLESVIENEKQSTASIDKHVMTILEDASSAFNQKENAVDRLRHRQLKHHLQNAQIFHDSNMNIATNRELNLARSLIALPEQQSKPGAI